MDLSQGLSTQILGQLTLMQSVVHRLPDADTMLKFVCRGFGDISGVLTVTHESKEYGESEGHRESDPEISEGEKGHRRRFPIYHKEKDFGTIVFMLSDSSLFEPYAPFIESFCNMLGIVFDEADRRQQNEQLKNDLEQRVVERTKDLLLEVAKHRQTATELEESEKRYREFIESTDSLVTRVDSNAVITYVNHTAKDVFGMPPEACIGQSAFSFVDLKDRERTQKWFENCVQKKVKRASIENRQISRNGQTRELLWNVSFKYNKAGQLDHVNSIAKDISQRRQLETQLRQAQKMEAIGTLAGGIAHDFNNILSPVLGYTELLQEDIPKDNPLQEYVGHIHKATIRASALVKQILTFSRQTEHENHPIKLQQVLKEVLNLLEATLPASIRIDTRIDPNCGVVVADSTQIHQIIMNLATNAYHAMQETGGTMTVLLDQVMVEEGLNPYVELMPGPYAVLKIIDTGVGIQKDVMEKIFDPYFTTKSKDKGTGLGLSVVQGIIKACNGEISIYSEPGKGSEIHVYLPIVEQVADHDDADAGIPVIGGTESILIVDDEPAIIDMEKQILERLGYQVTVTTSSRKAYEIFQADPDQFDLIISDMTMPDMNGVQLAAKLKTVRKNIPVIICTGFSEQISEESSHLAGVNGFVMKPLIRRELAQTIRDAIRSAN